MAKQGRIQCLDRAMDVMELIAARGEAGVSEVAHELGLNVATVHNIISTLARRHYLVNLDGRCRIGPALSAFASRWDVTDELTRVVEQPLAELAMTTGETPIVAVLSGTSLRVVATASGLERPLVHLSDRTIDDPLDYGTGHVLVAHAPARMWPSFIERHLPGRSRRSKVVRELVASLEAIRQCDHAVVERPGEVDSFAVPVYGPGDTVVAAVGVSCPSGRTTRASRKANLQALHDAAESLRRSLRGTGSTSESCVV